jgi:hypothetical protein
VQAARAAGLDVAATTVLTRSNFRVLAALPPLLKARGVQAWLIAVPRAAGAAAEAFDRVMPRLGLALPFALHALDGARRLGLEAYVQGAPLCALGPFAERALADEPRAFAEVCEGCPARAGCPGVDARYLARFGGDELAPRDPPAQTGMDVHSASGRSSPGGMNVHSDMAAIFVGVGEVAPAAEIADGMNVHSAPAGRVSQPLAGKVQPALREVSPAQAKKSGEALREIFPDLFKNRAGSGDNR